MAVLLSTSSFRAFAPEYKAFGSSMLFVDLIICFAYSLFATTVAVPTEPIPAISTPEDVNPSTFSPPTLPIVLPANNLTTAVTWRPKCWPYNPDPDPMHKASPITHPTDCAQAVLKMLFEGSDVDPLVWVGQLGWLYGSCGLFLVPSPGLPIHRDTFSRNEIAQSAEGVRRACVNEEHGYRGGIIPISAGVFQVALSAKPIKISVGEWEEGIVLNATAVKERASKRKVGPFGARTHHWKS